MSTCYCVGGQPTHTGLLHQRGPGCPSKAACCDADGGHKIYLGICGQCGLSEIAIRVREMEYAERQARRQEKQEQAHG